MASSPASHPLNATAVLAATALLIALAGLGLALANGSSSSTSPGTVEVNATGTATGSPDTLTVDLSVNTTASSAVKALNQNNTETHHLQAVFVGAGVLAKDLQTENLQVSPTYNQNGKISGYQADDDLNATLHRISKAGAVIDDAENAVGNDVSIDSINFSFSNNAPLVAKAHLAAMNNARAQAQQLAKGAGESLGLVEHITTSEQSPPPPLPFAAKSAAAGIKAAPVPIRAGTESVSVQVDVVFYLS